MDPANYREALREAAADEAEGECCVVQAKLSESGGGHSRVCVWGGGACQGVNGSTCLFCGCLCLGCA
jgi:hypothetical protein